MSPASSFRMVLLLVASTIVPASGASAEIALSDLRFILPEMGGDVDRDFSPRVATDGAGTWLVLWRRDSPLTGVQDIRVLRSTDDGETWTETTGQLRGTLANDGLQFVTDGNGTWAAVWTSGGDLSTRLLLAVSEDAGDSWTVQRLDIGAPSRADYPAIATDRDGTWIVTWTASRDEQYRIRSTDDAVTWSSPEMFRLRPVDEGHEDHPEIAADGAGNWIIVWMTRGDDDDIAVTRSSDGGATWSPPAFLNSDADVDTANDADPSIVTDGLGRWMVTWRAAKPAGGGDGDIYKAFSEDAGRTWSHPELLSPYFATDTLSDDSPSVFVGSLGHWLAVWHVGTANRIAHSVDRGETWSDPAPLFDPPFSPDHIHQVPHLANDAGIHWVLVDAARVPAAGYDSDILVSRFLLPYLESCPTDLDGDGFGAPGDASCPGGPAVDCDDAAIAIHPGMVQACDGINNDCDAPDWPAVGAAELDQDLDTFRVCAGDCDDNDPLVSPVGVETCNAADDNCDGRVDEAAGLVDGDGDGVAQACDPCPGDPLDDPDGDGLCNDDLCVVDDDLDYVCRDNCPEITNPGQDDVDFDGVGDVCDNCLATWNHLQRDTDNDGRGDVCDSDDGRLTLWFSWVDMEWEDEGLYPRWNVYRGGLATLRAGGPYTQTSADDALASRACNLESPVFHVDVPHDPPRNTAVFYLVTGTSDSEEGDLGPDGSGAIRPNANPCP